MPNNTPDKGNVHNKDSSRLTKQRILTVTAAWYFKPTSWQKGKFFYMYSYSDWTIYKYRFLGFCRNSYAFRLAELNRSGFEGAE